MFIFILVHQIKSTDIKSRWSAYKYCNCCKAANVFLILSISPLWEHVYVAAMYVKVCGGNGLSHVSNQLIDLALIVISVVFEIPSAFGVRVSTLIDVLCIF